MLFFFCVPMKSVTMNSHRFLLLAYMVCGYGTITPSYLPTVSFKRLANAYYIHFWITIKRKENSLQAMGVNLHINFIWRIGFFQWNILYHHLFVRSWCVKPFNASYLYMYHVLRIKMASVWSDIGIIRIKFL